MFFISCKKVSQLFLLFYYIMAISSSSSSSSFFFFWLSSMACRILLPLSGIEPRASAVKALSPDHREFPARYFFEYVFRSFLSSPETPIKYMVYSRLSFSRFLNLFSLLFFSLDIFCWSLSKIMDPFSAFWNLLLSPPVKFSFSHYILFCCRVHIWFFVISVSALKIYLLIYGCHTLIVKTWFLYFF